MQEIEHQNLAAFLKDNPSAVLIDVREAFEHEHFNIGGQNIPLQEVVHNAESFATNNPVIVYCKKGIRSAIAIQRLQVKYPDLQLINLQGGIQHLLNELPA